MITTDPNPQNKNLMNDMAFMKLLSKMMSQAKLFLAAALPLLFTGCTGSMGSQKIDREALVHRHPVAVGSFDTLSALTVGNGRFAFTVDATGLQSFPELYEKGMPLGTESEWGWHSMPNDSGYTFDESLRDFELDGRDIPYSVQSHSSERKREAVAYLRTNPHRLHLGMIGLEILHEDGSIVRAEEIDSIHEVLDPWTGEVRSTFRVDGQPVDVRTCCHQEEDLIASTIASPLISDGRLRVKLSFPYPKVEHTGSGCDWDHPLEHSSVLTAGEHGATIRRRIDSTGYSVQLAWSGGESVIEIERHRFELVPAAEDSLISFSCLFTPDGSMEKLPGFEATASESRMHWKDFWMSGAAVDFSQCTDPRALELERRVVLSQYLTRAQCAGSYPPQETGLTCNSWYGKFHLEMHWWHGVHFALWDRTNLLERSLDYYTGIAGMAEERAHRQGYDGLRWPKMTDPSGRDSPSNVGSFLIWQEPHIIYLAELCYRNTRDRELLEKYADIVFATADFMASYARYDSLNDRYVLGPLLIPAQERLPAMATVNPPFELAYWHWGLSTARMWRERLGLERKPEWDEVLQKLSPPAQKDGLYLAAESAPDSYTNPRYMGDHPMVLGMMGMLPPYGPADSSAMKQTFGTVMEHWQWDQTWGWDFPMTAMAATRLGMPEQAVDALMMEVQKNTWLPNGHNYQDQRLRLYLPGNGGLLAAVAMMCAGYEGSVGNAPGFPKNGRWQVRWEGFKKMP